jgi:hypothetical protein
MPVPFVRSLGGVIGAGMASALYGGATATTVLRQGVRPARPLPPVPHAWRAQGPVVLVGGFCTGDTALEPLRIWLEHLGYRVLVHTAEAGMDCAARSVTALRRRLDEAADLDHGDDGAFGTSSTVSPVVIRDGWGTRLGASCSSDWATSPVHPPSRRRP